MASPKSMPKDAQMIAQLLEDMGITEYEPRAIDQTLKFAFRYVTTVLDNAKIYSSHVRKTLLMQMCNWQYSVMLTNLFNSLPLQDYFAKQRNDDRDKL